MKIASKSALGARLVPHAPYLLVSVLILAFLLACYRRTGGHFSYALDDPYIHLALSDRIASFHYGINEVEPSSPSSSIIWPFLLALTAGTALHLYTPLLLNWVCALGLVWAFRRALVSSGLSHGNDVLGSVGPVLLWVLLNGIALVLIGMEHTLHVLTSVCIVLGVAEFSAGDDAEYPGRSQRRLPWWVVASLIVNPWIRYEGLALTGVACLIFLLRGRYRLVLFAGTVSLAVVIGFSGYLVRQGLPPLPSSVLVKSDLTNGLGAITTKLLDVQFTARPFVTLLIGMGFGVNTFLSLDRRARELSALGAALAFAHLLGGQYLWWGRYCVYLFAVCTIAFLFLAQAPLQRFVATRGPWPSMACASALLLPVVIPYLVATARTPRATADIWTQQHQMHRFATEFHRGPVAANDIGEVSYKNPFYVLDIWGLASEEARRARMASNGDDSAWLEQAAKAHGAEVAMVTEVWFPHFPRRWQRIAVLRNPANQIASTCDAVSFLLLDESANDRVIQELSAFAATLPAGSSLEILRDSAGRSLATPHACWGQSTAVSVASTGANAI